MNSQINAINATIPFLEGNMVLLRPLIPQDAYGRYPYWFNDPIACAGNSHAVYPYSVEDALDFISRIRANKDSLVLAIVEKNNKQHIGNCSLQKIDHINKMAELAIFLGEKDYWGKGFGTEAASLLVRHAFLTLNLNRVYFGTPAFNHGMRKIGEKLGMRQEGCRKEAFYKDGKYEDMLDYGLLRSQYNSILNENDK